MDSLNSELHRAFKKEAYGEFARIGQAVASPLRIEMLDLLAQRPWSVQDLAAEMDLTVANASRHLRILHAARLVDATRHGTYVHYRLASDEVAGFWSAMRRLGESRLAELDAIVRRHLGERDALEPASLADLQERVRSGAVILLDVRPHAEYRAGHLPGARSVPVEALDAALAALTDEGRPIVAYCRGPYCVWSDEAVARLRAAGHDAARLPLGVADWRLAGFPVERAEASA